MKSKGKQRCFPEWQWLRAERDDLPALPAFLRRAQSEVTASQVARVRESRDALMTMLPKAERGECGQIIDGRALKC